MIGNKFSKDAIIEMINNDLDLEMAIREKVEDIIKETLSNSSVLTKATMPQVDERESGEFDMSYKIKDYQNKLVNKFQEEEKEYYYLKGKGISTEMNDINFAVLTEELSKKQELLEILLEIFQ